MATKDFACTATLPVIYSGGDGANPGDLHMPIGKWDPATGIGYSCRALLKAPVSFAGMAAVTSAELRLYQHTAAGWHAKGSGSVNVEGRRKTSDWSESSPGTSTATDEIWGGDSGSLVSGGFTDDGGGSSAINNGAADGTVEVVDITSIAQAWFGGSPNYGLMLFAADSSTDPNDACEFYSRRASGKVPVIRITYSTNTAPNAPTGLNPSGGETVNTGRTITYSGTRSDPDSGDTIGAFEVEVWNSGHSTKLQTSGTVTGSGSTFSRALTLPAGYNANAVYEWRARTRDAGGLWGPWSGYQTFRANTIPNTPAAPSVETDTLAPIITGTFVDPDPGNVPSQAEVHVERADTGADMWLSTGFAISSTPWTKTYAGSALAWSVAYRARVRVRDAYGAWSAWSSWRDFTPIQPVGPDSLSPRSTATKLNTLTPVLTVAHSVVFRNDEIEVYAANSLTSTKLWTKAPQGSDYAAVGSVNRTYAGTALAWGGTYYWRARTEGTDGVISAWSPLFPFYINADPQAPANLSARNAAGSAPVASAGVWLVTVTTPQLEAEFADPDLDAYSDRPSERIIEIAARNTDGSAGATVHTNTLAAPPYSVPMVYVVPGGVLTMGTAYLFRWRLKDDAGRQSPWSAYGQLRLTTAPALTLTAPANASSVVDQTPLLDWAYSSSAGKPQATYQVQLFDLGPIGAPADEVMVHDSGQLAGAASEYLLPAGILVDDHAYRWQVTARDTDGLAAVLA